MRFQEIQRMAKEMDVNTFRMKKMDMIQAIQRKENNIDCFGTTRADSCGEQACLWKRDCLSMNNNHGTAK